MSDFECIGVGLFVHINSADSETYIVTDSLSASAIYLGCTRRLEDRDH